MYLLGLKETEPLTRYFVCLGFLVVLTWLASNVIRGRIGRSWMMIRDMDIAAELIGVRPLTAKLSAFAFSSFYIGISGALMVFFWLGAAEVESFDINHSFTIYLWSSLGGLGSITGCYFGAILVWVIPVILKEYGKSVFGIDAFVMENFTTILLGVVMVVILIVEPHGLGSNLANCQTKAKALAFPLLKLRECRLVSWALPLYANNKGP